MLGVLGPQGKAIICKNGTIKTGDRRVVACYQAAQHTDLVWQLAGRSRSMPWDPWWAYQSYSCRAYGLAAACLVPAVALGVVVPDAGWDPPRGSRPDWNRRRRSRFLLRAPVHSSMPKDLRSVWGSSATE